VRAVSWTSATGRTDGRVGALLPMVGGMLKEPQVNCCTSVYVLATAPWSRAGEENGFEDMSVVPTWRRGSDGSADVMREGGISFLLAIA